MFCAKCGARLEDDSLFCDECGAKVEKPNMQIPVQVPIPEQNMNYQPRQPMTQPKPGLSQGWKRMDAKRKGICIVILLAVICIAAVYWHSNSVVRLDPYVDVEFTGYDGIGSARVVFDDAAFRDDYGSKVKLKNKTDNFLEELSNSIESTSLELLKYDCIDYELDRYDHLKNGDEITLTWKCDDSTFKAMCGKKLKYSDLTFTVEGLESIELVDPFEHVEVRYEGIAPNGYASIEINGSEAYTQNLWYQLDSGSELSNGDTVRVFIDNYDAEYFAQQYGIGFSVTEKEYTVSGLGEYVATAGDISDDMMGKMTAQGADVITAYAAKNWDSEVTLNGIEYVGNYFLTAKGSSSYNRNKLILVYKVDSTIAVKDSNVREKASYYTYIVYNDILNVEEGVDLQNYEMCSNSFSVEVEIEGRWNPTYSYRGYEDLDTLYSQTVVVNADQFTAEDNIKN